MSVASHRKQKHIIFGTSHDDPTIKLMLVSTHEPYILRSLAHQSYVYPQSFSLSVYSML